MGASGWTYFTDYDPNPAKALQKLRVDVFASGKYGEAFDWERAVEQMEAAGQDPGPLKEMVRQRKEFSMARNGGQKPRTISEAIEQAGEGHPFDSRHHGRRFR